MQIELKPCPFCGRAVRIIHTDPSGYCVAYYNDEYAISIEHIGDGECVIDDLMLTSCSQREESLFIELWNRRVE